MPRLKNRQQQIPNGLSFHQPQTGWNAPKHSFDMIVRAVIEHRTNNKYLVVKHGWSMDYRSVANEVDAFNAAVCLAHGWTDYITQDTPAFPQNFQAFPLRRFAQAAAGVTATVKRTFAGVKVLARWLGSGLKPVAPELAEKRAGVCAVCKQNNLDPNWLQKLDGAVADEVKALVEIRNDLELKTSHDAKLGVCNACDCKLDLKCHVQLGHVLAETSDQTMAALRAVDPPCWIISEAKAVQS